MIAWSKDKNAQIAHFPEYGGNLFIQQLKSESLKKF